MGLDIDPHTPVRELSVGRQQVVEIAKAMSYAPSVLLLDEPTSALAAREVSQLFTLIGRLRERGVTMIYITHRLSELFEIADTCTVLRDGAKVGSIDMRAATTDAIVEMMFGSVARAHRPPRRRTEATEPVLKVENLTRAGAFENISFTLRRGEVLGLAGMLGAGRTEVLRAIFGADRPDSGRIVFDGAHVRRPIPKEMKHRGLGYTPENRKEAGLVQILSVHQNLCMASLAKIAPRGFITRAHERPYVGRQIAGLSIKAADPHLPVSALSGGNQQKIVIGNWLNTGPQVMFFDEPSRGIDVEAKQQIFEIIWAEASRGVSAIFVSVELEEVLEVCDRILVLRHGRIVAEVRPEETTLTELYRLCMEGAS
jgi:ribose transport system ATP-binding protein